MKFKHNRLKQLMIASLLVGATSTAWGALIAHEGFSGTFTDGDLVGSYSGVATGLTGSWSGGAADHTLQGSAQYGSGYMGGIFGAYSPGTAPTQVARKQGWGNSRVERALVSPIDLSADGTIYVSSFINCQNDNFRNAIGFTNVTNELYFGTSYNGGRGVNAVYGAVGGTNMDTGGAGVLLTGVSNTEPAVFMLATITKTNSGSTDDLSVQLDYWNLPVADANATDISGPPMKTRTIALTGVTDVFTNLAIQMAGDSSVDDVRIGTTLADVTGVVSADTDADGLDDAWEIVYFGDITSYDGTGDPDADNFTNTQEQANGTIPTNNDTDNDTLLDGDEFAGTSNSYDAAPTDPLNADSDGDGLDDFEENGSLNTGFANAATNPNATDTDSDLYSDLTEINAATDPNSAGSSPNPGAGFHLVEDFEGAGMTIGLTFDGVNGWTAGNAGAVIVADEPISGGDQVGSMTGTNNQTAIGKELTTGNLYIPDGATGTFFFQLYVGAAADHAFGLSDVVTPGGYGDFETQLFVKGDGGNSLIVSNAGADTDTTYNFPFLNWVNVWMQVNNAAGTYTVYVETPDGETGQVEITNAGTFEMDNGASVGDLISFFFIENAGTPPVYIDNLYVAPTEALLSTPAAAKPAPAVDSDMDGLDDNWEINNFGDLTTSDGTQDADGDFDTDLVEFTNDTDPNDFFDYTDTDADLLPDSWEIFYIGNLDQDENDDLESDVSPEAGDGLINDDEFLLGTSPIDSDTDDDGLTDGDEDTVYDTDPLLADTDGDGLDDGAEVSADPYVTDPSLADTDLDGYDDGTEIDAGSDPTDIASTPLTVNGCTVLIGPTEHNGSFETLDGVNDPAKEGNWDGTPDVDFWSLWDAAVSGPATASGDSGTDTSGAATNGTKVAFLQPNNAAYNRTGYTVLAGDVFTYTWDWALAGRGAATGQLAYWDPAANGGTGGAIAIVGTDSTSTGVVETISGSYSATSGDPAIGLELVFTIATTGNYPEVDNVVLCLLDPITPETEIKITNAQFNGANFEITVSPDAGPGTYILTSSDDLTTPFAEVVGATYDGTNTFTVLPADQNAGQDFYRVEEAPAP